MIDFRYHLVSIIAVFLALTVGLVLGTTMLQDPLLNTMQSETADLRGQSEELRAERDTADRVNAGADAMAEELSEDILDGRLRGLGVVLVAAPGADGDLVGALGDRVEEADGEVVGRLEFTEEFVDGDNAAFVNELTAQIARDPDRLSGSPYGNAGAEIGRALARAEDDGDDNRDGDDGAEDDDDDGEDDGDGSGAHTADAVLAAFAEGGLITMRGEPAESVDAVVVVAPADGGHEAANTVLTTLTTALRKEVGSTVLAGGLRSAGEGGVIAHARAGDPSYATVDLAGRPMGDIITVLALADGLGGDAGAYGVGAGAEGFLPQPLPGPRALPDPEDDRSGGGGNGRGSSDLDEARRSVRNGE